MFQDSYSKDYTRPDPTIPEVYVLTLVTLVCKHFTQFSLCYLIQFLFYNSSQFSFKKTHQIFSRIFKFLSISIQKFLLIFFQHFLFHFISEISFENSLAFFLRIFFHILQISGAELCPVQLQLVFLMMENKFYYRQK